MSSIPGYSLEEFLAWQYGLRVQDQEEANVSVGMAVSLGLVKESRPLLTKDQFDQIVKLHEEYRESVEDRLIDFDEETQSWRMYAEHVDSEVPESVFIEAKELIKTFTQQENINAH